MILHHPDEDLLLSMAAGRLPAGQALVVAVHLDSCPQCRTLLRSLEAVGGTMLDCLEPQPLLPEALACTLQRIAGVEQRARLLRPTPSPAPVGPPLPEGVTWPASLRGSRTTRWYWMGPGRRFARVQLPHEPGESLLLLSMAAGRSLPAHGHHQLELTQVLCGALEAGGQVFGRGDFMAADQEVHHRPVVQPGEECICLTWVKGGLRFDGPIAGAVGGWLGV
ncbi:MAG: hypothetical protein AVDCRST_MAG51-2678 [uncultured Ramlibacter sp.]|uniref:ChrR-like cupin domain-containing protein n=1 Tax=uncultured Ramlibacter sp. TaxID=260755 RepID=A0A6J4Q688_9BURK|nr:MAG: hypothetical protein AVDCRST_MAG51-2678 [uncultured Ramlibacter sp.]